MSLSLRVIPSVERTNGGVTFASIGILVLTFVVLSPMLALVVLAFGATDNIWPHLLRTVLPDATLTTLLYALGIAGLTAVIGTSTSWLVTMCNFPGRKIFTWALILPLSFPTYLAAFCYIELFDYSGWLQSAMRTAFGWKDARDYWFPEIRSLPGAIVCLSLVLYPYVYLTTRASFMRQPQRLIDASRTMGCTAWSSFTSVALPLARPAIVAGAALGLMEALNDIGAVEFFGVNTLTLSVYSTWLERGSLGAASQIACAMLVVVIGLLVIEKWSRRGQRFAYNRSPSHRVRRTRLTGLRAWAATGYCLLPIFFGFAVPMFVLIDGAANHWSDAFEHDIAGFALNSLMLAAAAAGLAVILSTLLLSAHRIRPSLNVRVFLPILSVGYAVPGTVLAIGVLVAASAFDRFAGGVFELATGVSAGLILSGTSGVIVFAYVVRFFAISLGNIEAGYSRLAPHLDDAARSLGRTPAGVLKDVHLPLLRSAIGAGLLLVFIDSMKELPATLLLRPFNFDTLATHVYTLASLDLFEEASPVAIIIVATGLIPVLLANRLMILQQKTVPRQKRQIEAATA